MLNVESIEENFNENGKKSRADAILIGAQYLETIK
jgi:hypothetical protein